MWHNSSVWCLCCSECMLPSQIDVLTAEDLPVQRDCSLPSCLLDVILQRDVPLTRRSDDPGGPGGKGAGSP